MLGKQGTAGLPESDPRPDDTSGDRGSEDAEDVDAALPASGEAPPRCSALPGSVASRTEHRTLPPPAWPLLLVVLLVGAALSFRLSRSDGTPTASPHAVVETAGRPGSLDAPEADESSSAPRTRTSVRTSRRDVRRGPRLRVFDVAPVVLYVAGLAGLLALLAKRVRAWMLPPPSTAPRTVWGLIELGQGLMLFVAFHMITGELLVTFLDGAEGTSTTAEHLLGLARHFSLAAAIVVLVMSGSADRICAPPPAALPPEGVPILLRLRAALRTLGLSLDDARTNALRGLVGGCVALPVAGAAALAALGVTAVLGIEVHPHPVMEQAERAESVFEIAVIFVSAVIVVPLGEEFVFRGFIFPSVRDRWGLAAGILASSLLFSLMHMQSSAPNMAATFVLGVVFCGLYERSGTLLAPVVAHAYFNLAMLSMMVLERLGV